MDGDDAVSQKSIVKPGEQEGLRTLDSFLTVRGVNYRADMSSPVEGWDGCSRLSPYLAWGNVSLRTVYQHQQRRLSTVRRAIEAAQPLRSVV